MKNKDVILNLQKKYELISIHLNERARRIWAASEAKLIGHGGIAVLSKATGFSQLCSTLLIPTKNHPTSCHHMLDNYTALAKSTI